MCLEGNKEELLTCQAGVTLSTTCTCNTQNSCPLTSIRPRDGVIRQAVVSKRTSDGLSIYLLYMYMYMYIIEYIDFERLKQPEITQTPLLPSSPYFTRVLLLPILASSSVF